MFHELIFVVPYFLVVGILVGLLSMLFGIGGGLIIVPAVSLFLQYSGYAHNLAMKSAVATSLLTIMISALNVLHRHHKNNNVPWVLICKFLPCVVIGSLVGSVVSSVVPGVWLAYLFVIFLFCVIVHAVCAKNFKTAYQLDDFVEPGLLNKNTVGFTVGLLSVLIGVGGNILLVPYLRHYKFPMKNATAFTVGLMPALAFIGSIGYFIEGLSLGENSLPPYSVGYVNMPAFGLIILGSFLGAFFGQKMLAFIHDKVQAKAYLIFLVVIFCCMVCSL
jgi:hypothetical protein